MTAALLREAADRLEESSAANGFFTNWCRRCNGPVVKIDEAIPHTPDCLITRLRSAADQMEKLEASIDVARQYVAECKADGMSGFANHLARQLHVANLMLDVLAATTNRGEG